MSESAFRTDEAMEWVRENTPEWVAEALEGSKMWAERTRLGAVIAELKPKADAFDRIEGAPRVAEAFREAGVDWDAMKPLEREAAEGFTDIEDREKLEEFAAANALPLKTSGRRA